ncbi:hypothetical protein ONZ45_g16929 [Pleurotus djamor]|nr:hypothetical protein ONZ45_g16929 [Pleurotus djamor]
MQNASHPRFPLIKKAIAAEYTPFEARITKSWAEVLSELSGITRDIISQGTKYIPEVDFSEIDSLSSTQVEAIKSKGCVVVRNLFDRGLAEGWKATLEDIIKENPTVQGFPPDNPQFYEL